MAGPLYGVPGLGGYLQAQEERRKQQAHDLDSQVRQIQLQASATSIADALQKHEQERRVRAALVASNGDPEKALEAVIKEGDLQGAARLTPLAKIAAERRQAAETQKGLQQLYGFEAQQAQNPMVPGPGASVMAGSGPAPSQGDPRAMRRAQLQQLSLLYPTNAQLQTRIQAELGKLDEAEKPQAPASPLGRYIADRDRLPAGHPDRPAFDRVIGGYQTGPMQVNVNPSAPNAPLVPGKPAQNKIDEGLLESGTRQQQLVAIERQFKPEYQTIGTRWDALKLSARDKSGLGFLELDPGERRQLTEFSQYKRTSIDALNKIIQSLTGAAMSEAEAQRIIRGFPNPGTGLFDGDSPTEFKAKLDDALKQVRMAEARHVYMKRNGLGLGDVPLERMPQLMNDRGKALEASVRKAQPKSSDADVKKFVRRLLAQEFGLVE